MLGLGFIAACRTYYSGRTIKTWWMADEYADNVAALQPGGKSQLQRGRLQHACCPMSRFISRSILKARTHDHTLCICVFLRKGVQARAWGGNSFVSFEAHNLLPAGLVHGPAYVMHAVQKTKELMRPIFYKHCLVSSCNCSFYEDGASAFEMHRVFPNKWGDTYPVCISNHIER